MILATHRRGGLPAQPHSPAVLFRIGAVGLLCLALACTRGRGTAATGDPVRLARIHSANAAEPGDSNIHGSGHRSLPCAKCHTPQEEGMVVKFSGAVAPCINCHRPDDEHNAALGERCEMCHSATRWNELHTTHARSPVPLVGAHSTLPCQSCHPGGRSLIGQGGQCITCHQNDDVHHQSLGPRCADCHTQVTFAGARFLHDSVGCTLRGIHRTLPCVDCHKGGNYTGLSPLCISCHRDDALRARAAGVFPEQHAQQSGCSVCHNAVTFRGVFTRPSPPESVCQ